MTSCWPTARANALRRAAYADRENRLTRRIAKETNPDEKEYLMLQRYELRRSKERRLARARAKIRAAKRAERWRRGPRKRVLVPSGQANRQVGPTLGQAPADPINR